MLFDFMHGMIIVLQKVKEIKWRIMLLYMVGRKLVVGNNSFAFRAILVSNPIEHTNYLFLCIR
jgi:hypothetical protein